MMLIGIGSNLPGAGGATPLEACRRAAMRLDALPDLRLSALSRWYSTEPVPPSCQPAYVNAVAVLRAAQGAAEPDPAVLLAWLHAIEADGGRLRSLPNAARTLDLDIIAMGEGGQLLQAEPDPVLPHPRAHLRAFVLVPLLDVAPDWVHPVLRRKAAELLAVLLPQEVAVLD
jgi:2-amino-4-hydroxy-6-hydroxymethyldihydropteridine diphosphokinase